MVYYAYKSAPPSIAPSKGRRRVLTRFSTAPSFKMG